jgi:tRNA G18 (ribose-2'-O)-methylase SpoU
MAARGLSGALDANAAQRHRGRVRSGASSAQWPFGLPEPDAAPRPRLPLALAAISFSYNLNLGVLIRSAEAAGASEVLLVGRDFFHRAAAMGAERWLELRSFETSAEMVAHARARGYQLVAVQQSPGAERFDRADYPPRPCIVLGSEGPGLPPELCAQADLVVEIPQRGEIDSLNVSAAASIVLWACLSRRGWL